MADPRYEAEITRVYDAPRALVWGLVADTNRTDRALGLSSATYRWERRPDGRVERVATGSELGVTLEWIEPPYEWVEGRSIATQRTFVKGPVARGGFTARVEDAGAARTRLVATTWLEVPGAARWVVGPVQRAKYRANLARYADELGEALRNWRQVDAGLEGLPAAVRMRHLVARVASPRTVGVATPTNERELEHRARRLREAPVLAESVERLVAHLRARPDDEVSQMRPFELAGIWGLDRREVLRTFLHATAAGLVDLRWQINCPVCRVGASVVKELAAVGETTHCVACQIQYDTDFARHVEAVFPSNEAVRAVTPLLYCASSPAFTPHVLAQARVAPGQAKRLECDLPVGTLQLRVLGRAGMVDVDVPAGCEELRVQVADEGLEARALASGVAAGADAAARRDLQPSGATLTLTNAAREPATLVVERGGWTADAALGSIVGSFPELYHLFSTEAPARGVDLKVSHLAVLFSDLVGSTALYQRVGDAAAYAVVEDHFRLSEAAVEQAGGAIVKTMGDAIMATFPSLEGALVAARDMVAANAPMGREHGLGVKLGAHAGPCLAVRANDRLDFFGTTVNLAARLQAQARAGELVLLRTSLDEPGVGARLTGRAAREFTASLKGIEGEQALVGVALVAADG
jgi:class 3 adenylate cyclase